MKGSVSDTVGERVTPRLTRHHSSQKGPWLDLHTSVHCSQSEVGMHMLWALSTANPTLPGHFRYRTCSAFMQYIQCVGRRERGCEQRRWIYCKGENTWAAHNAASTVLPAHPQHNCSTQTHPCTSMWALSGCSIQHACSGHFCRSSTRLNQARRHSQISYQYKMSSHSTCAPFLTRRWDVSRKTLSAALNLWWRSWLAPFLTLS